jgi:hypothetical protein
MNAKDTARFLIIFNVGDLCSRNAGCSGAKIFQCTPYNRKRIGYIKGLL